MTQPTTHRVEITLQGGMRFDAAGEDGATIALDVPGQDAHGNAAFRPMELLLIGLGSCTAMDVISILRKKRQDITNYRVEVDGVQASTHPKVYTEIFMRHIIYGNNVSDEAVRRSIQLSEDKYCPAYAMLQQATTISSSFEVHPAVPAD